MPAVEADVGVGEVVHEDDVALAGQVDQPLHVGQLDDAVVGLCGNDSTTTRGLGQPSSHASMHVREEVLAGADRDLRASAPAK